MIRITVNEKAVELDGEMPVKAMLDIVDVPPNYLAVEINGEVVPREDHESSQVRDGDVVEVVTLVGGG